jgi:hypothetical protein
MSALTLEDGSVYEGSLDSNGKLAGWGTLYRADGTKYTGDFADGAFHGEGTLSFSNGTSYSAQWERGAEVPGTGALQWEDGLVFNPLQGAGGAGAGAPAAAAPQPRTPGEEWGYLSSKDRRFWDEHASGARAATSPQKREAQAQTLGGGGGGEEAAGADAAAAPGGAAAGRA